MADGIFVKDEVQDQKSDCINYNSEIRQMMYGFGDSSEPMIETVKIVEEIVLKQMRGLVSKACEIADLRGSQIVIAEDFLFLLRKDKIKLQRLIKYLKLKEFKTNMCKKLDLESIDTLIDDSKTDAAGFMKFIKTLDNTGELLKEKVDYAKQKRIIRAEMISRKLDETRYIEYSKARCASFSNKNRHKFSDWIGVTSDFSISKLGYTVLGYLAYETVAQIVELALTVRQDQNKIEGDPIDRLRIHYPNPITYKPYQYTIPVVTKAITPAEVCEALRRFWSPLFDFTGPFHRSVQGSHKKFLAL